MTYVVCITLDNINVQVRISPIPLTTNTRSVKKNTCVLLNYIPSALVRKNDVELRAEGQVILVEQFHVQLHEAVSVLQTMALQHVCFQRFYLASESDATR
jgi:hypothetical protein